MFKIKTFIPTVVLIICTLGFVWTALNIQGNQIRHFDKIIIASVQRWESPSLTIVMKLFTTIGGGLPLILLMITVMVILHTFLGHRKELIFLAVVMLGSTLINWGLKTLFHRVRPDFHRLIEVAGYSFPSGHSMAAFSFYGALAYLIWSHIPSLLGRSSVIILSSLFVFAIGTSRIYLGVHYPSDVIGGYFVSGCWLILTIMLYDKYMRRRA